MYNIILGDIDVNGSCVHDKKKQNELNHKNEKYVRLYTYTRKTYNVHKCNICIVYNERPQLMMMMRLYGVDGDDGAVQIAILF